LRTVQSQVKAKYTRGVATTLRGHELAKETFISIPVSVDIATTPLEMDSGSGVTDF
jgi:hypothetical protein